MTTHEQGMAAAERFAAIVGAENVLTDAAGTAPYADPFFFDEALSAAPPFVVRPGSAEEVQAVVRAAAEAGFALWTVSRGRNLGYGGASPRTPDTGVLDLSRMNRILEVDVESAYAVVEPGVSFFDLAEHLRAAGGDLWPSVPDLGGGSVLGNALERGFGYTAYGSHSDRLCGLDVVLPDGELLSTGMGAVPGSREKHLYRGGFGPSLEGLFLQSNLGVVVRAGVWLMPRPEKAAVCTISADSRDGLGAIVDAVRPLMLSGVIEGVAIVGNALALASGVMPRSALVEGPGLLGEDAVRTVMERFGAGWWNSRFGLYGPAAVVEAKLGVIRIALEAVPGVRFHADLYDGDVALDDVHAGDRSQLGIPSADLIQMAAWRGGTPAHVDFSLVCSTKGDDAQRLVDAVRERVEAAGIDHVGGFTMFGRHAIMLTLLAFDRDSAEDRARVAGVMRTLLHDLGELGHAPYRAHPAFMDETAALYSANDGSRGRVLDALKDALDPAGVLSPGKQGVWGSGRVRP